MVDVNASTTGSNAGSSLQEAPSVASNLAEPCRTANVQMAQRELEDERHFMECIRQHRVLYDRTCPEYRENKMRANAWLQVCRETNLPLNEVQKRYSTVRTRLSRYLKSLCENPGEAWTDEPAVPREFEHVRWLIIHIRHRKSSSRGKRKSDTLQYGENISDDDLDYGDVFAPAAEDRLSPEPDQRSASANDGAAGKVSETSRTSNIVKRKRTFQPSPLGTTPTTEQNPSRGRVAPAAAAAEASTPTQDASFFGQSWSDLDDEDRLFCLSLVYHLKKLPPRRRSLTRMQFQRILHDAQFGSCMESQYSMQPNMAPVPLTHTWPNYFSPATIVSNPIQANAVIRPDMPRPAAAACLHETSQANLTGVAGVCVTRSA